MHEFVSIVAPSIFAPFIFAHGIGSRSDLPLPFWVFSTNAVAALIASFVLLGLLWPASRLAKDAVGKSVLPFGSGKKISAALTALIRAVGLLLFGAVLWASLFSPLGAGASIAPVAIFVVFWVGVQLLSAVFGDIWRLLSPWDTMATIGAWLKVTWPKTTWLKVTIPVPPRWVSGCFAVVAVAVFLWMELVYPEPSETRLLGWLIFAYTALMLCGATLWGRRWLRENEGFAMLFTMIGAMGIFSGGNKAEVPKRHTGNTDNTDNAGEVRVRWPIAGLANLKMTYFGTALVLVVLGSTTFDGLSGTLWWTNLQRGRSGWETVPISTLGLLGCVLAVTLGYYLAMAVALWLLRRSNKGPSEVAQTFSDELAQMSPSEILQSQISLPRQAIHLGQHFSHSLIPLLVAYSVAHYFSLLVFEGQDFLALLSDPFTLGWDIFGTAHFQINYRVVSAELIAWVQALAIVIGHVAGVMVAHDRAVELLPRRLALRSQYPLLAVMVGYTITGLILLLKA